RRFSFASQPNECFLRFGLVTEDPFQCYDPFRMTLARAIDDAHSTAPDFFQDLIVANPPIGIAHVDYMENLLKCLRGFRFAVDSAMEHAIQAKPTSHARCRSTP